jgi:hypothetical protein
VGLRRGHDGVGFTQVDYEWNCVQQFKCVGKNWPRNDISYAIQYNNHQFQSADHLQQLNATIASKSPGVKLAKIHFLIAFEARNARVTKVQNTWALFPKIAI